MVFWKFSLVASLAILAVAVSNGKPLDNEEEEFSGLELRNFVPNLGEQLFSKENLREIVEIFYRYDNAKKDEEQIVNDHVDKALIQLNSHIVSSGLDPTKLQDEGFEFSWKVLLITYHGEMTLKNGWLQGLATLGRVKDCTLSSDGKTMILTMSLTFTDLLFNYDYRAKFMNIGPKGGIDGKIADSKFTGVFEIDVITLQAELSSFKLNKPGKLTLRFTGNILTDWMVNIFASVTTTFLKPVLRIFISGWVLDGVYAILALYNESICNIVGTCF